MKKVEADSPELRELSDGVNEYAGGLLKKALDGGAPKKLIVVPGRIVNVVV